MTFQPVGSLADRFLVEPANVEKSDWLNQARQEDDEKRQKLVQAKEQFNLVEVKPEILSLCVKLATEFQVEGNRGDYVLAMAASACAALDGETQVNRQHLQRVAPLALQHRRSEMAQSSQETWSDRDREILSGLLGSE